MKEAEDIAKWARRRDEFSRAKNRQPPSCLIVSVRRHRKNRALDQLTAGGEDRPMQTGVAHFCNARRRQEPSHLVEK
jgi:hypothetical protein